MEERERERVMDGASCLFFPSSSPSSSSLFLLLVFLRRSLVSRACRFAMQCFPFLFIKLYFPEFGVCDSISLHSVS